MYVSGRSHPLVLNHKYENKPINLPILDDWKSTHDGFYGILVDNGVAEEDSRRIQRFCSSQHEAIIDHFAQQTLAHMSVGQRAKKERIEKAKNGPPIDVTIAQALTMHEGNVRVKGMISTGSDKMEKMITRVYFRCGECDHYNTLVDYMDNERYLRPVFIYELPQCNLKDKECIHGCKSSTHELREEVINAYRIELQETETFNDKRLNFIRRLHKQGGLRRTGHSDWFGSENKGEG